MRRMFTAIVAAIGIAGCAGAPQGAASDAGAHAGEPAPFDETADAEAEAEAALAAARLSGKRVLLVVGGDWCHDSRSLAKKFAVPELAALIAANYELKWIDVGRRERNLDVPARFGVPTLVGTPTILILSADGKLLNRESVHDWRNADDRTLEETIAYFRSWARP